MHFGEKISIGFGSRQTWSLLLGSSNIIKGFNLSVGSPTGSTMSSLHILSNTSFSLSSKAIVIFLTVVTTGVIFWLVVMWWTLGSVPISPKQSLHLSKKLHFWELEVDSLLLIKFNCLLEFSPVMGGEFVSTTINKGTFLLQCWMSIVLLLVYCFHYMHLGSSFILLFLVLFAEFQSGFLELHWLEYQSRFCSRCWSHWYRVWLTTQRLTPRRLCWFAGCCFWLTENIKNDTNEEIVFV